MGIIDIILDYLNNPSQYFDQFTLQTDEETLTKMYSDFYGDTMSRTIKSTKIEVANDMGLDSRVLSYILSRTDSKHREITFYEALRFCVATNLNVGECLAFLSICNYSLCLKKLRDRIIYIVLSTSHHTKLGMDARLDCIAALEDNEPWNTDDRYEYLTLFSYIRRKREGVI